MRADEIHVVSPSLAVWQAYAPAVKCELTSCARRFGNDLVFIDPIPLAKAALAELTAEARPVAIIVTNGNHARAAADFRERFSIPIHAHAAAAEELGISVDQAVAEGDAVLGKFSVLEIAGAPPGEIALHAEGIMHAGDALIHLDPLGFTTLPDQYCADPPAMRRALGKLLRFDFELLTFAHGLPLVSQARRRLEHLLA